MALGSPPFSGDGSLTRQPTGDELAIPSTAKVINETDILAAGGPDSSRSDVVVPEIVKSGISHQVVESKSLTERKLGKYRRAN